MGFDFTIAITPNVMNIDKELEQVKAALLYADKVTLISPLAYFCTQLSAEGNVFDARHAIRIFRFVLPMIEKTDPDLYKRAEELLDTLNPILSGKKYRSLPYIHKIEFDMAISQLSREIDQSLFDMIGEQQAGDLKLLLQSGKLHLQKFEHNLGDTDGCVSEFFGMLTKAVKSSFPLFDEISSDLMSKAIESRIVRLSDSDMRKITHAGLSENFIQRLPSFESAPVDVLLDIKEEFSDSLTRLRSKMLAYSDGIQLLPWDQDFQSECTLLYDKEVAPALLEIDTLTKENSFIKNLGKEIVADGSFLKSAGGLAVGIAAAGIIPSFTQAVSTDTSIIVTGGAWAVTKVAAAYDRYIEKKREIEKKDLFFYYQAGKILKKKC